MGCWLMKAEPETRLVNGHDVKFSAEDFERDGITSWEGVRNHEAKKILKEKIKIGDLILFYASNCKVPRITSLATCVKEGYPDHNAWDPKHAYFDPKSDSTKPTWFMVDLSFTSNLPHSISLKLLQHLASLESPPAEIPYLSDEGLEGIKKMALLNRGRLSVQPVEQLVYDAIVEMGMKGGFEDMVITKKAPVKRVKKEIEKEESESEEEEKKSKKAKKSVKKKVVDAEESDLTELSEEEKPKKKIVKKRVGKKS